MTERVGMPFYDTLPIYSRSNAEYNLRVDIEEDNKENIVTVVECEIDPVSEPTIFTKIKRFLCGFFCRSKKVKLY